MSVFSHPGHRPPLWGVLNLRSFLLSCPVIDPPLGPLLHNGFAFLLEEVLLLHLGDESRCLDSSSHSSLHREVGINLLRPHGS